MNVVRVKAGTRFDIIAPGGFRILSVADDVAREAGVDLEITCGTEGHAIADPHTKGQAYDFSVYGFDVEHVLDVRARFIAKLGQLFTVLYERPDKAPDVRLAAIAYVNPLATAPHIHVQVKNGVTYPPLVSVPSSTAV